MKDKTVLITGGGSGIGRETGLLAVEESAARVIVSDINLEAAEIVAQTIREKGAEALAIQIDVGDPISIENGLDTILSKYDHIDVLVNSAGICPMTPFDQVLVKDWNRTMDINLTGSFLMCQKIINSMIEKKINGAIVNVGSIAGKVGGLVVSPQYAASKAGLHCMTISAAKFAAKHGIRVNAVAPGTIDNELTKDWNLSNKSAILSATPLGRLGTSIDSANAIIFLASSKAAYITGEILDVNGGTLMD